MGLLAGVYFMLMKLPKFAKIKEAGVALIYTLGIWGIPLWVSPQALHAWIGMGLFFLIGYLNLLCYSLYDYEIDQWDHSPSLATAVGVESVNRWIGWVASFFLLVWGSWIFQEGGSRVVQILLMAMFVGTLLLLLFKKRLETHYLYRYWGECVFYWPLILYGIKG